MKTFSANDGLNVKLGAVQQAQSYYEAIREYYDEGLANDAEI